MDKGPTIVPARHPKPVWGSGQITCDDDDDDDDDEEEEEEGGREDVRMINLRRVTKGMIVLMLRKVRWRLMMFQGGGR